MTGNFTSQRADLSVSEVATANCDPPIHRLKPVTSRPLNKLPALGITLLVVVLIVAALAFFGLDRHDLSPFSDGVNILIGILIGALTTGVAVWWVMRRALRRADDTAEGLRARLMSVERNQALWVSLSAVLHDVRNPLHNVSLLMETVGAPGVDLEQTRQRIVNELERIQVRMRRVSRQVSAFLEVERRPVALRGILCEVEEMIRPLAKQAGANFSFHCAPEVKVLADPKFLVQAVDHLLLNSLQILAEQGPERARRLSVSTAADEGAVVLAIADTGPGLPDAVRNNPFEPMSTQSSGMGIGLTIAHALTRAAGGELSVSRTDASGTQFHLRLVAA